MAQPYCLLVLNLQPTCVFCLLYCQVIWTLREGRGSCVSLFLWECWILAGLWQMLHLLMCPPFPTFFFFARCCVYVAPSYFCHTASLTTLTCPFTMPTTFRPICGKVHCPQVTFLEKCKCSVSTPDLMIRTFGERAQQCLCQQVL